MNNISGENAEKLSPRPYCPIDKAGNKKDINCKKYYIEIILMKIGHIGDGKSKAVTEGIEENVMCSKSAWGWILKNGQHGSLVSVLFEP